MVCSEIKNIHFTFENCEGITIPGKYVRCLDIDNITKSGSGSNLWHNFKHYRWYKETEKASDIKIGIDACFLNKPFKDLTGSYLGRSIIDRIKQWQDITWITITNKEYWCFPIFNPFLLTFCLVKRMFRKHKLVLDRSYVKTNGYSLIKIRKTNKSYTYQTPWFYNDTDEEYFIDSDGKKRYTEYVNKYQSVSLSEDNNIYFIDIKETS